MIPHGLAGDSPCYQSEIKSRGDCEAAEDKRGGILLVLMHGRDFKLIHGDSTARGPPEDCSAGRAQGTAQFIKVVRPHPTNDKNAVVVHLCVQTVTPQ